MSGSICPDGNLDLGLIKARWAATIAAIGTHPADPTYVYIADEYASDVRDLIAEVELLRWMLNGD